MRVKDFDELNADLKKSYDFMRKRYNEMCETLKGWNKDVEIQKREREIAYLREHSLRELDDEELKKAKDFRAKHFHTCGNGSHFSYDLVYTGIGVNIVITCPICKTSFDITNYNNW